ncbi:MAG: class I SAM-dependent methyltransferase [Candidatus Accumulibacter sp.]|nr:class I SAM-dependent methyltransferase [Accumulibacter sp.]
MLQRFLRPLGGTNSGHTGLDPEERPSRLDAFQRAINTQPIGIRRHLSRETDSIRETGSLDIDSPNARHAVRYEPSPSGMVRSILSTLGLDWRRYTFVDFGAGKGRVLLLAAELPFKNIIGVEFSPNSPNLPQQHRPVSGASRRQQRASPVCA